MIYENLVKVRGPYESSKDHRLRCVLVFNDKATKSMSYPKYLMETHLDRYLTETEKIDIKVDIFVQDNVLESMDVKFKIVKELM